MSRGKWASSERGSEESEGESVRRFRLKEVFPLQHAGLLLERLSLSVFVTSYHLERLAVSSPDEDP